MEMELPDFTPGRPDPSSRRARAAWHR
jgi:hypothetical protein